MLSLQGKWASIEIMFLQDYKDLLEETLTTNVTSEAFNMAVQMAVKHRICDIKDIAKEFNKSITPVWRWVNHGRGPSDVLERIAVFEYLSKRTTQRLNALKK